MIKQIPALAAFNGMMFEHVIEQYRQMTADFQQLTIEELQARLAAIIPIDSNDADISSEMTLLRKRIANKGRGTSIRGIIDQMPHLLPALCPCMLMSPLSVAQYIDIDAPKFDLVIFDEASQMPTGEAVGAIARGKAIVVVGDPKQMPPTSFFTTAITDDDNADMDDLESILDDCISLSIPNRYLGWHYRSQHESLISFCNKNYYDGKLLTFPSADDMVSHVNYVHVDGIYDYGKSRSNRIEAEKVVEETMRRLSLSSSSSIGIVAFSKQQSDLIEDLLNEALSKQPELETKAFNTVEPLFVKNLENVQGDERDVIILSIGYGPDKDGHISMNFGPLNKVGGERRLNVALSRARSEMIVFSSLRPDQIDERRTNADGVLGLKNFMQYAEQSCMMSMHIAEKEDVEVVIQEVVKQLTDKGYQLQTNVGTSSFRVNIAIVDNRNPERYLLGIICDGKRYYALKTTRDREVVQPTVLKMLGWNLMHLWTLDWFSHPDMVIKGIEEKIESIRDEVKIGFK